MPLIALYQAVREGWDPPETVSEDEYRAARALPDTDPRKAFVGFGCSFGAKWFGGYARGGYARVKQDYAGGSRRALIRQLRDLRGSAIERIDFLSVEPRSLPLVIYADPPYAGTEPYSGVAPFDSARFWSRAQGWERAGVPVFVSEYTCPVPHALVLEVEQAKKIAGGNGGGRIGMDRLFRVLP